MHLNLAGFGRQDNLSEILVLELEEKITLAGLDIDFIWSRRIFVWGFCLDWKFKVQLFMFVNTYWTFRVSYTAGDQLAKLKACALCLKQTITDVPASYPSSLPPYLSIFHKPFPNSTPQFVSAWFLLRGAWLRISVQSLTSLCFTGLLSLCKTDVITYTSVYDVTCFVWILANSFVS